MLSEGVKRRFAEAVDRVGLEAAQRVGPAVVVGWVADRQPPPDALPTSLEDYKNLLENRQEAEQYVASLLGMM